MNRRLKYLNHLFALFLFFAVPVYLLKDREVPGPGFYMFILTQSLAYAVNFYVNYFVLTPHLFFRRRKAAYFLSAAALIAILGITVTMADNLSRPDFIRNEMRVRPANMPPEGRPRPRPFEGFPGYNFIFTSILITGFSFGLRVSEKYAENEQKQKEAEKERLNSELAFLKNQVSPHFFFNTLNNIYSLVEIDANDARQAILQLSKLMRYLLYESEHGNTLLSSEIAFMENYISLMRLRLTGKVDLMVKFPQEYEDVTIPPLLFIPFVENAFKHGINNREASFIHIFLEVNPGEVLFRCDNSLHPALQDQPGPDSGIGQENVKKRLALLFPGKHDLYIGKSGNTFHVKLRIQTE